jgi:hypothetical protein
LWLLKWKQKAKIKSANIRAAAVGRALATIIKNKDVMELLNEEEFKKYVKSKLKCVLKGDYSYSREFAGHCNFCKRDAYLKILVRHLEKGAYESGYSPTFATFLIQCPSCERKSFLGTIVLSELITSEGATSKWRYEYYELFVFPAQEARYELADIPSSYPSLIKTVSEALFCLENSQFISAAIMFRRALQILAKDILGAKGKELFDQLEWLKTNPNSLGINLTNMFHDNSELIRKIGNQGAHPSEDLTLQDFTEEDANALHDLFIIIINEVFIVPAKMQALKNDLKSRRKIQ